MARKKPSRGDARKRTAQEDQATRLPLEERVSLVCNYFLQGYPVSKIQGLLSKNHDVQMNREAPWRLVSYAASQGWLRFVPPSAQKLTEQICREYPWLSDRVNVVGTGIRDDVAYHGARVLLELIRRKHAKKVVHVGIAGGQILQRLSHFLAQMLSEEMEDKPKEIVFHALVANFVFAGSDPTRDPSSFYSYFTAPAVRDQCKTSFIGLPLPGIVQREHYEFLRELEGVRESYERKDEIDIFVSSAGHWGQEQGPGHSSLCHMFRERSPETFHRLEAAGMIGDFLWCPLGQRGALETETVMRAMTLLDLKDLPDLIRQDKKVLLIMGPCGHCKKPKPEVLKAILHLPRAQQSITHLVVDSNTAKSLFEA